MLEKRKKVGLPVKLELLKARQWNPVGEGYCK